MSKNLFVEFIKAKKIFGEINKYTNKRSYRGKKEVRYRKKEKGNTIRGSYNEKTSSGFANYLNIFTSENKKVENEIIYGQKNKDNLPLCCIEVVKKYILFHPDFLTFLYIYEM